MRGDSGLRHIGAQPDGGPVNPRSDGGKADGQRDAHAEPGSRPDLGEDDEAAGCAVVSAGRSGRQPAGGSIAFGLLLASALVLAVAARSAGRAGIVACPSFPA